MTIEILGDRVYDDSRAEREGILVKRRGESVVDDERDAGFFGDGGNQCDRDQSEGRVRWGLGPDHLRISNN